MITMQDIANDALVFLFTSISAFFQLLVLNFSPARHRLLAAFVPRFHAIVDRALRQPSVNHNDTTFIDYYVDPDAAKTLQLAALAALSSHLQAQTGDPLPPSELLPKTSYVLLQTDEPVGGSKYLEAVASQLAAQMNALFLPVDAILLASLLAEAFSGTHVPENYLDMFRGSSFGGSSSNSRNGSSKKGHRAESQIRFAWEALDLALKSLTSPVVVFLRSADALLCTSWESYSAFSSVFGGSTRSIEAQVASQSGGGGAAAAIVPPPLVLIAGAVFRDVGAALIGSKSDSVSGENLTGNGRESSFTDSMRGSGGGGGSRPDSLKKLLAEEEEEAEMLGGGAEDMGLMKLVLSLSRLTEEPLPNPRKLLPRVFPTLIKLKKPPSGPLADRHRAQLRQDAEKEMVNDNYSRARAVAVGAGLRIPHRSECIDMYSATSVTGEVRALSRDEWEKVLAWAVSLETVQKKKSEMLLHEQEDHDEEETFIDTAKATDADADGAIDSNRGIDVRQKQQQLIENGSRNNSSAIQQTPPPPIRRVVSAIETSGDYFTDDITKERLIAPLPMASLSSPPPPRSVPTTTATTTTTTAAAQQPIAVFSWLEKIAEKLPGGKFALNLAVALARAVLLQLLSFLPFSPLLYSSAMASLTPTSTYEAADRHQPSDNDYLITEKSTRCESPPPPPAYPPYQLSEPSLLYGLAMLRRSSGGPRATIKPANSYEKQLLGEVLAPEDLGAGFSEVGALNEAKRALIEAVQLPLQRPDLFVTGALAKPCTGVLLFGPPGTGKTLLARAAAAESGASFLELSLSSISSKWFGDSTKLVRAAFTLAEKLAPCVLFVDEVDALLGKRSSGGREHEATREVKNEFMARWDSIRGGGGGAISSRVMVLGASNRPFDLDEAVLRRFSTRVAVELPGKKARTAILKVILQGQALGGDVNAERIAEKTEGFSGADLSQLCVAAAMRPVRELIGGGGGDNEDDDGDDEIRFGAAAASTSFEEEKTPLAAATKKKGATSDDDQSTTTMTMMFSTPTPTDSDANTPSFTSSPQMMTALENATSLAQHGAAGHALPRPVCFADFESALKEVGPTVDPDSASVHELKEWNAKYGSVGARGAGLADHRKLQYYT